jgi:hypothetical protein
MSVNSVFAIPVQTSKPSKAVNIAIWGVQILTALAFLAAADQSWLALRPWSTCFIRLGLGNGSVTSQVHWK